MQTALGSFLVNYQIFGARNKETIIILHGWGRNLSDWLGVADFLASKFRVILIDLPGFGGTSYPQDGAWGIYEYANFVVDFLKKLEIKKPIILGHSLGGRIGIILGSHSDVISKLVLVDTAGVEERSLAAKIKITLYKISKTLFPKFLINVLRAKIASPDYLQSGRLRDSFIRIVNQDLRHLFPKIKVPVLIIWGEKDEVLSIKNAKLIQSRVSRARVRVVWEAGHHPHLEKPEDFISILKEELL